MALPLLHVFDETWFLNSEARPIMFSPYESHVTGAILETRFASGGPIDRLRTDLVERFKHAKINASVDNKTVFVVDLNGQLWTLGFYDLNFTLGTSFRRMW